MPDGFGNAAALYLTRSSGTTGVPPTLAPYIGFSGYDVALTQRRVDFGGGGYGTPDANDLSFWTAPTYTETVDTGALRLHIGADGRVAVGDAENATGLFQVASSAGLGSTGLRVNVSGATHRIAQALALGTDAAPTANTMLDVTGAGGVRFARAVATTGAAPNLLYTGAAHTGQTASTETLDVDIATSATLQHATGALATQRTMLVRARTYSFVGASTITDAASLAITNAPIAGTNATITNAYALWVQAGKTRLQGAVVEDSVISPTALGAGTTNDYAPTGLSGARIIRQDVSAATVVTGLVAQQAGQLVVLMNIATAGGNTLTLNHDDGGSTAANRFLLSGLAAVVIPAGGSLELWYDGTSSRWRTVGAGTT
jgi:hypothetical protein